MSGSPTMSGPRAAMASVGESAREFAGAIMRSTLGTTGESLWRTLTGYLLDGTRAFRDAEVFSGVGIYARPPTNVNAEAIVASLGGEASAAVVVATRDEDTRKAVAGAIAADETILYNSVAIVYVKSTGLVEIRLPGGVAVPLALKSDVENLRTFVSNQFDTVVGHKHPVLGGPPAAAGPPPFAAPPVGLAAVVGTTVLKGQ